MTVVRRWPPVAIRRQLVAPEQGDEERPRPCVGEREPVLDGLLGLLHLPQALSNALPGVLRRHPLAGRRPACEQRLDPPELLDQVVFGVDVHAVGLASARGFCPRHGRGHKADLSRSARVAVSRRVRRCDAHPAVPEASAWKPSDVVMTTVGTAWSSAP